jgi:hypothetical protein
MIKICVKYNNENEDPQNIAKTKNTNYLQKNKTICLAKKYTSGSKKEVKAETMENLEQDIKIIDGIPISKLCIEKK